ncbi:MAG: LysR family transcriptional regulator [Rhodobacteraceae bacterium]|nr:LysR family transcriptional regulator [Paracoccaceae bacterium]
MMNPRALKLFHIIADKGSLAAASEHFHLSPPAASRLISLLEEDLGFMLFSREGRKLTLTENGLRFLRESQPILYNFESIDKIAQDIKTNAATTLRVLSTSPIATAWIAPALGLLQKFHPLLACTVEIVDRRGLQSNVGARAHDIAVASLPIGNASSTLKTHPLCQFRFEAVLHKDHPLAAKAALSPADIAAYPIIALHKEQIGRVRLDEFFRSQGVDVVPRFETSSSIVSLALCRQNLGVALVPSVYLHGSQDPELVGRPITPDRLISFGAITTVEQSLSDLQISFISCLKQIARGWPGTIIE